jgi:hypothetical protein
VGHHLSTDEGGYSGIRGKTKAPPFGGHAHLGLRDTEAAARAAEGMTKDKWDKMAKATIREDQARAAVEGLTVACALCDWTGTTLEDQHAHACDVHGKVPHAKAGGRQVKICLYCKKSYGGHPASSYCCATCRCHAADARRRGEEVATGTSFHAPKKPYTCTECGRTFVPTSPAAKTCGKECAKARRTRQKEAKNEGLRRPCACGCGELASGVMGRTYRPGHNNRAHVKQ